MGTDGIVSAEINLQGFEIGGEFFVSIETAGLVTFSGIVTDIRGGKIYGDLGGAAAVNGASKGWSATVLSCIGGGNTIEITIEDREVTIIT